MTSTALLLLSLPLAWSIVGTALEPTFDYGSSSLMTSILNKHEINYQNMKTQRTKDSYRHFKTLQYDRIVMNKATNSKREDFRQAKHENPDTATKEQIYNLKLHKAHEESRRRIQISNSKNSVNLRTKGSMRQHNFWKPKPKARRFKRQEDDKMKCESFNAKLSKQLSHPGNGSGLYYSDANCITVIEAQEGKSILLTFVDQFNIEDHPDCAYDYLEIRDGKYGFSRSLGKYCGFSFPNQIRSTGPFIWIKFYSDDTIEYEGFHINIEYLENVASHSIPDECYIERKGMFGYVNTNSTEYADCKTKSGNLNQPLDVLWKITAPSKDTYKIYLNFTSYLLGKTNECEENVIEVYGSVLEYSKKLARYCGSVANPVLTHKSENGEDKGDIMYVRFYASRTALSSSFNATYTVFRQLNPIKNGANLGESDKQYRCSEETEFDCEDSTCIAGIYKCDGYAQCRLKTDEDPDICKKEAQSVLTEPEIRTILIIFSLILSGMIFVFLFKCLRKLYEDQIAIKEHIRQSCEDRLDSLVSSQLMLDPKRLQRNSEPRASLERENHTNEMFKRQRNFSQNRPISIDSDYVQEPHLDLDDELLRRDVDKVSVKTEEINIERNGKHSRRESKKEPSSKESKSIKEVSEEDSRSRKDINVSVAALESKESGCQTRESLLQEVSSPEGTESGSGSRGFSAATIVRPSSPAPPTQTSQLTVELMKTMPSRQESHTKKIPDRRPMSTETTRSAPDVIIVSKPIR